LAAISLAPALWQYRLIYSEHLFAVGKKNDTIVEATKGLDYAPISHKLHFGIGLALATEGKPADALPHFTFAAGLEPNWAEPRFQLGLAFTALGRLDEALTNFYAAVSLQPTNAEMVCNLASAYSATGHDASAAAMYERALQLAPDNLTALNNLAWIRAANPAAGLRDGAEAVRLASHASDLAGGKVTRLVGTLAAAYAEAGQFDEAVATANKAIELARAHHEQNLVEINQKLLAMYQANRAYHEDRPVPASSDK
jgi:Flp pilus assembly protein TadD